MHQNVPIIPSRSGTGSGSGSGVWGIEVDVVSFFLLAEDGNTELVIVLQRVEGVRGAFLLLYLYSLAKARRERR